MTNLFKPGGVVLSSTSTDDENLWEFFVRVTETNEVVYSESLNRFFKSAPAAKQAMREFCQSSSDGRADAL